MTTTAAPTSPPWSRGALDQIRDTADLVVSDPETATIDQIRAVAQTLLTLLDREHADQVAPPGGSIR